MASELRPWHAVATPHRHSRHGRLDEAMIAAKVWAVVQGTAPEAPGASARLHNPLKFRRPDPTRTRRGHHRNPRHF